MIVILVLWTSIFDKISFLCFAFEICARSSRVPVSEEGEITASRDCMKILYEFKCLKCRRHHNNTQRLWFVDLFGVCLSEHCVCSPPIWKCNLLLKQSLFLWTFESISPKLSCCRSLIVFIETFQRLTHFNGARLIFLEPRMYISLFCAPKCWSLSLW